MIVSIVAALIALLITYWWASSGAWSAFLHMLCVVIAGALAFALWEPVAYLLLPTGFANYSFGVTLLTLFLVILCVFRLVMDRVVGANMQPPRALNLTLGAAFGLVSGVLTTGIMLIGAGFIQSSAEIGDASGYVRRSDVAKAPTIGSDNAPLLLLVSATADFYDYLSGGAFTPWLDDGSLGTHRPDLTRTSFSLFRDSYNNGLANTTIDPDAVSGLTYFDAGDMPLNPGIGVAPVPAYGVSFTVTNECFDGRGQQFILAASQARLLGAGTSGRAAAVHPTAWEQDDGKLYYFNSPTSYATSQPPGAGQGSFTLYFPKDELRNQTPRYLELKGVRFKLPTAREGAVGQSAPVYLDEDTATRLTRGIEAPPPQYGLPITLSSNNKGDLIVDDENYILGGSGTFNRNANTSVGGSLRIRGFKAPEGSRVIRLDASVSSSGGARLFPDVNPWVRDAGAEGQNARVAVVDENGTKFYAIGYANDDGDKLTIFGSGGRALRLRDLPVQSLGASQKLQLFFAVPFGSKLKYLVLDTPAGMHVVNTMDFAVPTTNN